MTDEEYRKLEGKFYRLAINRRNGLKSHSYVAIIEQDATEQIIAESPKTDWSYLSKHMCGACEDD